MIWSLITLVSFAFGQDSLLGSLNAKGHLKLNIHDSDGKVPQRILFQKTANQRMLSVAACSGFAPGVREYCSADGKVQLEVRALRLVRQRNGQVRVTLKTNLGTFRADPLLSPKRLFSGEIQSVTFPRTEKSWGATFGLAASGRLSLKRSGTGFVLPKMEGQVEALASWWGSQKKERDRAILTDLTARRSAMQQ